MTKRKKFFLTVFVTIALVILLQTNGEIKTHPRNTEYRHTLTKISSPEPILADFPDYIEPLLHDTRYLAPPIIDDKNGSLIVRSWRYSYAARGIIEMENRLDPSATALINVHPWGCDDGHGLKTPEPNGVLLFCTPTKNEIGNRHTMDVINPFMRHLRSHLALIAHSLPGVEDPIRKKLYPSIAVKRSQLDVDNGEKMLTGLLGSFPFTGKRLIPEIKLDNTLPLHDYFSKTVNIDAGDEYNGPGFWDLPIPLLQGLDFGINDIVLYDDEGYDRISSYLKNLGIRHILITGHLTDVCVTHTTCGFQNMSRDFNIFLVGDATLAAFPASTTPKYATQAALTAASLNLMITQISWVRVSK